MLSCNRSISTQVIFILVTVATIILLIYAVVTTLVYRNLEMAKLHNRVTITSEQLQTAIAGSLWYYDMDQLDKMLEGGMKDRELIGIVVKTSDRVYARSRNAQWESVTVEPAESRVGMIIYEQPVIYSGAALGTITLFATTKFLNQELINSIFFFGSSILVLDFFLVLSLYWIFSRIVLEPLKKLKSYAVSVSGGNIHEISLEKFVFTG